MNYTPIKCPNCSANLPAQKTNETIYCEYCGTPYFRSSKTTETAYRPSAPPPPPPPQASSNNPYIPRKTTSTVIPPRPTINMLLFVVLIMFYVVPGVLYLMHVTSRQKEWDFKYGKK